MIELHRAERDKQADSIAETLDELVVSYRVVVHPDKDQQKISLPYLSEGDAIYSNPRSVDSYLEELRSELNRQRSYSSDSCYIDPETGDIC